MRKKRAIPDEACLLLKAAKVIEERGWCRGELENENTGHVCMLGGIYTAAYGSPFSISRDGNGARVTISAINAAEGEALVRYQEFGVAALNDGVFRSGRQATAFLRRTAKKIIAEADQE